MHIFVTGTDTNVGKTLVSSWLCLHTNYDYFKPIQTGNQEGTDSKFITQYTSAFVHPETYSYKAPLSPHVSAELEGETIDIARIQKPANPNVIIEGAGGVLVPINKSVLMIDLIAQMNIPTLIVSRSTLGTINHTLLTIEALKNRNIPILGIVMNGINHPESVEAIAFYGKIPILITLPFLTEVSQAELYKIPLPKALQTLMAQ